MSVNFVNYFNGDLTDSLIVKQRQIDADEMWHICNKILMAKTMTFYFSKLFIFLIKLISMKSRLNPCWQKTREMMDDTPEMIVCVLLTLQIVFWWCVSPRVSSVTSDGEWRLRSPVTSVLQYRDHGRRSWSSIGAGADHHHTSPSAEQTSCHHDINCEV